MKGTDSGMNDVDMIMDKVGEGYELCILGDLNEWIRDRVRAGITGDFGVQEEIMVEEWWISVLKRGCV